MMLIRRYVKDIPSFEVELLRHFKTEALAYLRSVGYKVPSPSHAPDTVIVKGARRLYLNGKAYVAAIPQPMEDWRDENGMPIDVKPGAIHIASRPFEEMLEAEIHEAFHLVRPRPVGFADDAFRESVRAQVEAHIKFLASETIKKITPGAILRLKASRIALILDKWESVGFNFQRFMNEHATTLYHLYYTAAAIKERFPNLKFNGGLVQLYDIHNLNALRRQIILTTGYHFDRIADRVEKAIELAKARGEDERDLLMRDHNLLEIIKDAQKVRELKKAKIKRMRDQPYGEY